MLVASVMERLEAKVEVLAGRISGAAALAELMRSNSLPQVTPAAHVLPLGLQGGQAEAGAGLYTQVFEEMVAVLLTLRSHERSGARALDPLDALIRAVVEAVAGWGPDEAMGVFRLTRGSLVSMTAGTLVYQIEFALSDQLRIAP